MRTALWIAALPLLLLAACSKQNPSGSIDLPRQTFRPGETVTIKYKVDGQLGSNAWVGIVPDNLPHDEIAAADQQRLASQPLTRVGNGELTFTVPQEAGEYDFRIYTDNPRDIEVASNHFSVEVQAAEGNRLEIHTNKDAYKPGEEIIVNYSMGGPAVENQNRNQTAWIGLATERIGENEVNDRTKYIQVKEVRGNEGELRFKAPANEGGFWLNLIRPTTGEMATNNGNMNREHQGTNRNGNAVGAPGNAMDYDIQRVRIRVDRNAMAAPSEGMQNNESMNRGQNNNRNQSH